MTAARTAGSAAVCKAIPSAHSLLCDVTLAAMGRSRINTRKHWNQTSVLYTTHFPHPHFPHSSFSALLIIYIPHSAYFTESFSRYYFLHLSLCSALKSIPENKEKPSFRTCWRSSSNFRPTLFWLRILFWPKSKIRCMHCS